MGEVKPEHLSAASFTKACLQETYRICPTAFCLARMLEEDTTLSGYDLKAGVRLSFPLNTSFLGLILVYTTDTGSVSNEGGVQQRCVFC